MLIVNKPGQIGKMAAEIEIYDFTDGFQKDLL